MATDTMHVKPYKFSLPILVTLLAKRFRRSNVYYLVINNVGKIVQTLHWPLLMEGVVRSLAIASSKQTVLPLPVGAVRTTFLSEAKRVSNDLDCMALKNWKENRERKRSGNAVVGRRTTSFAARFAPCSGEDGGR